jgi:hypothetical protein
MPVFIQMDTLNERIGYTMRQEGWPGTAGLALSKGEEAGLHRERRNNDPIRGAGYRRPFQLACGFLPDGLVLLPLRPSSEHDIECSFRACLLPFFGKGTHVRSTAAMERLRCSLQACSLSLLRKGGLIGL